MERITTTADIIHCPIVLTTSLSLVFLRFPRHLWY